MKNMKHMGKHSSGYCKSLKGAQYQESRKSGAKLQRKVMENIIKSGMTHLLPEHIKVDVITKATEVIRW